MSFPLAKNDAHKLILSFGVIHMYQLQLCAELKASPIKAQKLQDNEKIKKRGLIGLMERIASIFVNGPLSIEAF